MVVEKGRGGQLDIHITKIKIKQKNQNHYQQSITHQLKLVNDILQCNCLTKTCKIYVIF